MAEQLTGTVPGSIVDIRILTGSNALYVFDVAGTALLGSVETTQSKITVGSQFTATIGSTFALVGVIPSTTRTFVLTHENANTLWIGFASPFTYGSGLSIVGNQYLGFDNYTGSIWGVGSPTTSIVVQVGVI